ncbi:MarR family transcriptional regulator [Pseudoalteromonas sp. SG43-7]|uniref:MarR family winged helix-turn-helix transcriptional regulator n=1 Tax=Pseudoalteromonas sp. SG43-7 TaxID=2760966 RepID=UPI0016047245|nr:MarR family transcriptional regulator [Pseudoalteromonas sp. SG43-7]MBB1421470.1 MarR family transcriptional regulator [Pseudoalteromonas sp. SG43-7]
MISSPPFHETLDLSLCGSMGRVFRLCRNAVTLAVEPLGLTQSRWTAMIHIHHLKQGVTQQELASSLGIEMPSLTRTIKQLEQQAIIVRRIDSDDKRSRKIYFTEQGLLLLDALRDIMAEVKTQLYAELTTQQLDTMAYGLVQMEANARRCISHFSGEK